MYCSLERWECRRCKTQRGWGYASQHRPARLAIEAMLNCHTCNTQTIHVYVFGEPITETFRELRSPYGHPNMQKREHDPRAEELLKLASKVRRHV